jgi:cell division FtsZ-interacting protein ZapD
MNGVSEDERWSLIKMVHLQVNRLQDGCSGDEMHAAWATSSESSNGNSEKQRGELAAAAHGKTGRPAQELNHVNLVQELLALRETASRVHVAHHMWRHTTGGQGAATVSSSHAQLEPTANAMSAAPSSLTRHAASMRAAATAVLPAPPG